MGVKSDFRRGLVAAQVSRYLVATHSQEADGNNRKGDHSFFVT